MPGSIFISNLTHGLLYRALAASALSLLLGSTAALAADSASSPGASPPSAGKTFQPEEEDFTGTPFTEYGEFNEDSDEEADAKFMQHGRLFGVSLGLGFEGVTGNRGVLWQGGFPAIDFKLHYWFDFNFALDLGMYFASHFYDTTPANGQHVDTNMIHVGIDGKYYFDTKNLSSAISFANPYLMVGFGSFTKTETSFVQGGTPASDTGLGISGGGGVEFAITPRKTFLQVEGRYHIVSFKDTYSGLFSKSNGAPDLTGGFYTFTVNALFTW